MKFKKVRITQELLVDVLHKATEGRLPSDMIICGVRTTSQGNIEFLMFSHVFPDLPEGFIPELEDVTLEDLAKC